ncbi:hypothetical protein GOQ04_22255 [Emticicia sp. ODNR4P]|nr:hypothetical protein [Emticicia sp. ODNR4P]
MSTLKSILIIATLMTLTGVVFGQDNPNVDGRLKELEVRTKKIEDEYKQELQNTREAVNATNFLLKKNTSEVEKLIKQRIETDETKFQRIVTVLHSSSEFVKSSNKSFKAIDVSLMQTTFLQEITKLNNPTNNDLGFSLKELITQLLNKHIVAKDKSLNKSDKLNKFVSGILNNPITDIVKSAIPSINTVVSFISNISFGSNKVNEEDFNAFVKGLQAYIKYYEGLANATNEFQSSLEQIKIRTKALEMILENYTIDRVSDLYREKSKIDKPFDIDKLYAQFGKEQINDQVRIIKTVDSNDNLVKTLQDPRLNNSMTVLTQARYIQDELETLTNQYINAHQVYFKSVIEVLNYSKTLEGADKDSIDRKISSLNDQLNSWSTKFTSLVDVDDVKKQVKELNKHLSIQ